jgi:hypothetical protein
MRQFQSPHSARRSVPKEAWAVVFNHFMVGGPSRPNPATFEVKSLAPRTSPTNTVSDCGCGYAALFFRASEAGAERPGNKKPEKIENTQNIG